MFRFRICRVAPVVAVISVVAASPLLPTAVQAIDTGAIKNSASAAIGLNPSALARIQRRQEAGLAACMKKQGFEYFVEGASVPQDALDGGFANRRAFVDKYGYGIATLVTPPKKGEQNKNVAYTAKLSTSDMRAYNIAFFGSPTPPANANSFEAFGPKSCVVVVNAEVYGDLGKLQQGLDKYAEVGRRVNADSSVIRTMREWSACRKKAGYSYSSDSEVEPDFTAKLNKLFTGSNALGIPDLGSIDVAGLEKLKRVERATAKADWDCSKAHLGTRDKVAAAAEKKFIAENQGIINDLKKVFAVK